jgi:hypothetical protein
MSNLSNCNSTKIELTLYIQEKIRGIVNWINLHFWTIRKGITNRTLPNKERKQKLLNQLLQSKRKDKTGIQRAAKVDKRNKGEKFLNIVNQNNKEIGDVGHFYSHIKKPPNYLHNNPSLTEQISLTTEKQNGSKLSRLFVYPHYMADTLLNRSQSASPTNVTDPAITINDHRHYLPPLNFV